MFRKLLVGAALTAFACASGTQSTKELKEAEVHAAEEAFKDKDAAAKTARNLLKEAQNLKDYLIDALTKRFNEKNEAEIIYKQSLNHPCSQTTDDVEDCKAQMEVYLTNYNAARDAEEAAQEARRAQEKKVETAANALATSKQEKEAAQQRLSKAETAKDDDLEYDNIEDGSDGIPGGTGQFSFDVSDFELDSVGSSRSPAQIEAQRANELRKTKDRIGLIRGWYAKQRQAALKGVYSPSKMNEIKTRHSQRIKVARQKIENYKKAVELRYIEYKKLYDNRSINQDQYKNVTTWRRGNIRKAKDRFNTFRDKVKKNWTTISNRNETRQDKRREKLEEAREAALKQIEAVKREYRKKDDKLQIQLRRPQDGSFEDDIFGSQLFGNSP